MPFDADHTMTRHFQNRYKEMCCCADQVFFQEDLRFRNFRQKNHGISGCYVSADFAQVTWNISAKFVKMNDNYGTAGNYCPTMLLAIFPPKHKQAVTKMSQTTDFPSKLHGFTPARKLHNI